MMDLRETRINGEKWIQLAENNCGLLWTR
jgi:hypothetical protein